MLKRVVAGIVFDASASRLTAPPCPALLWPWVRGLRAGVRSLFKFFLLTSEYPSLVPTVWRWHQGVQGGTLIFQVWRKILVRRPFCGHCPEGTRIRERFSTLILFIYLLTHLRSASRKEAGEFIYIYISIKKVCVRSGVKTHVP